MLVFGTVNPVGENNNHKGLYLTENDIQDIISSRQLNDKPVLLEHKGDAVGKVVSAWQNDGRLDCIFEINSTVSGLFAQYFVQNGKTPELSLGYSVEVEHSADGQILGGNKRVVEVSIVKKGARENCLIRGICSETPLKMSK